MRSLLVSLLLIFFFQSNAQINKGQFLVGGSGTFSSGKYTFAETKFRTLEIDGNAGFFILNKLAAGLHTGYNRYTELYTTQTNNFRQFQRSIDIGPFVRYYFLNASKKFNLLADASYYRSWSKSGNQGGSSKHQSFGYSFGAGPVFFLNPHVSLESTVNYEYSDELILPKTLRVKLGFQVHLSALKSAKR
ncbi:outer membrane beta-barrel protein [Aridibaculum aurantiacum]|uniref:outer membrane beta-barrel protein n=1 Tax=Aridibaculum aurantiacum TaxID=2810307 RepID=UPI001A97B9D7|nr:outer membrane beta-barrel protein [Aridibaculum aurantiacum]